jgi:hypothetical protein
MDWDWSATASATTLLYLGGGTEAVPERKKKQPERIDAMATPAVILVNQPAAQVYDQGRGGIVVNER